MKLLQRCPSCGRIHYAPMTDLVARCLRCGTLFLRRLVEEPEDLAADGRDILSAVASRGVQVRRADDDTLVAEPEGAVDECDQYMLAAHRDRVLAALHQSSTGRGPVDSERVGSEGAADARDEECPMTTLELLICLHEAESFLRMPPAKNGKPYAPGYFPKRDWSLHWKNRRVSARLMRTNTCLECGETLSDGSTGDHILPVSRGGPSGAENYMPLCRRCNSSKGSRDLLEWWHSRDRTATELPLDVIVAYARLVYQCEPIDSLTSDASADLSKAWNDLAARLPTAEHRQVAEAVAREQSGKLLQHREASRSTSALPVI